MIKRRRRSIGIIIGVGTIILGTALWLLQNQTKRSPEKITLAEASQPVFALVYVAEDEGYFADQGLEVTYQSYTSGRDALASVITGQSDIATVYETPLVLNVYAGEALSVLTTLHTSTKNTALVARRDHGIETPETLRGKTIAVTKNTNGEFFLSLYLTSEGIRLSELTLVDTKPEDMAQTLREGLVDAAATWNPNLYNTQQAFGEDEIQTFFSDIYTEMSVLAGRSEFVTQRKEACKRLLRALLRAEAFIRANEEEALRIVTNRLSAQPAATTRAVWPTFKAEVKLDNLLLTILEQEAKWFKHAGNYHMPVPDFREVIFTDYLKDLNPDLVTVF